MAQTWHDLLFAHWRTDVEQLRATLRPQIPDALDIDTFQGEAWIGVVPFRMSGVRLRATPAVPTLSAFPELNVRTAASRESGSSASTRQIRSQCRWRVLGSISLISTRACAAKIATAGSNTAVSAPIVARRKRSCALGIALSEKFFARNPARSNIS
jgi:hypothetical protein